MITINPDNTVTMDMDTYEEFCEDEAFLRALEAAGVDNWCGYDIALEILREDD